MIIGQTLGKYTIDLEIGVGGMGAVYLAHQTDFPELQVAIKIIRPELVKNTEFVTRLEREARVIALLDHPHIIKIRDYGRTDDLYYLIMDYKKGGTLYDLIQDATLPSERVQQILEQMASALDYAHGQNVLHRDLKPSNILLDDSGNAFLADFGIAKDLQARAGDRPTGVIGTPNYMSLEALDGKYSRQSDIYALSVIVYQMLTGRLPYEETATPLQLVISMVRKQRVPLHDLRPDLPPQVDMVLEKAGALSNQQPYASASAFAKAFKQSLTGKLDDTPNPRPPRTMRLVLVAAVLLVIIGIGLSGAWLIRSMAGNATPNVIVFLPDPTNGVTPTVPPSPSSLPVAVAQSMTPTNPPPTVTATETRLVLSATATHSATVAPSPTSIPASPTVSPSPTVTVPPTATETPTVADTATVAPSQTPIPVSPTFTATLPPTVLPTLAPTSTPSDKPTAVSTTIASVSTTATGAAGTGTGKPSCSIQTIGVWRNSFFYLHTSNTSGAAELSIQFGLTTDRPIVGNWDGQRVNVIGVFRDGMWYLAKSNTPGTEVKEPILFGTPGDLPLVGDWTGSGRDSIGVYRPSNRTFYLRPGLDVEKPVRAIEVSALANATDIPIAGDWNGDGITSIGLYRQSNNTFYLSDKTQGPLTAWDYTVIVSGTPNSGGLKPFVGRWTNTCRSGLGLYDAPRIYLKNSAVSGRYDTTFLYGNGSGDSPLAGTWR